MFDSVLAKSDGPQQNVAGVSLSLLVFGAIAGTVTLLSGRVVPHQKHEVDVKLVTAKPQPAPAAAEPPAPPPPPPPAGSTEQRKTVTKKKVPTEPKPQPEPDRIVAPVPAPTPEPANNEPASEAAEKGEPGGVAGGVPGGVAGGVIGGKVGGVLGGTGTGTAAIPFGVGMTRPSQIAGAPPSYSREAVAARVEGKVLVRCVIATDGSVQDCKVIKGVPFLDVLTVDALRKSRFTPVMYQGRAAAVQYLFTFNFKLP
ncbi:MAG: TonB family protein [Polyangiales bacterium]